MDANQTLYRLRVYGLPKVSDQRFNSEGQGIAAGRRALASRRRESNPDHQGGYAELNGLAGEVWSAYVDRRTGSLIEKYEREPGCDDE